MLLSLFAGRIHACRPQALTPIHGTADRAANEMRISASDSSGGGRRLAALASQALAREDQRLRKAHRAPRGEARRVSLLPQARADALQQALPFALLPGNRRRADLLPD